jgi:hypothetical protein
MAIKPAKAAKAAKPAKLANHGLKPRIVSSGALRAQHVHIYNNFQAGMRASACAAVMAIELAKAAKAAKPA